MSMRFCAELIKRTARGFSWMDVRLILAGQRSTRAARLSPLTAKEHTLLETLARNEGKIVTVDALCEALWGDNPFGYENSLNAHVRRIREKIEADPSKPVSLITIKGLGYKLITRK